MRPVLVQRNTSLPPRHGGDTLQAQHQATLTLLSGTDMHTAPQRSATVVTRHHPLRWLLVTVALALAAGVSQTAMAQPDTARDGVDDGLQGGMHDAGRGHRSGMFGRGDMGHMAHMGRMLDAVNATPEQRAQIKQIMEAAHTDLKAQRSNGFALRQQSMALLAQTTIDARAVETVRQQMLAQHDTTSKRMTQAMVDAANVLTPTQRQTLAGLMAKRQAMVQRHQAERQSDLLTRDKSSR
jgi:periplasmic protein CpxP/Spy